jgi:hypothetical protein
MFQRTFASNRTVRCSGGSGGGPLYDVTTDGTPEVEEELVP